MGDEPSPDRLEHAIVELAQAIRDTGVSSDRLIPDLVAIGLAREVYENARATLLIASSDVPRAVYPSSRAAFEASQDLALLVTGTDYDESGARAFAAEILDWNHSAELAKPIFDALSQPQQIESIAVDQMIGEAAQAWDQYAPGKAEVLAKAFAAVKADRAARRFHWSGLSRTGIHAELGSRPGAHAGTSEIYRSWYNLLSFQSHPSPRLDQRHMDFTPVDGFTLIIQPDEPGRLSGLGVSAAFVAVQVAILLLRDIRAARGET